MALSTENSPVHATPVGPVDEVTGRFSLPDCDICGKISHRCIFRCICRIELEESLTHQGIWGFLGTPQHPPTVSRLASRQIRSDLLQYSKTRVAICSAGFLFARNLPAGFVEWGPHFRRSGKPDSACPVWRGRVLANSVRLGLESSPSQFAVSTFSVATATCAIPA